MTHVLFIFISDAVNAIIKVANNGAQIKFIILEAMMNIK